MLVCTVCGEVFDESEVIYDRDVNVRLCPMCENISVKEAERCEICGEYFYDEDNTGVCDDCLKDEYSVETALKYGAERMESVAINGAFYAVYSEEEINAILTKHFEEHFTDKSKEIVRYCEEDKQDFADWLIEKRG